MKKGDLVKLVSSEDETWWSRCGLIIGFRKGFVQVHWGEDFPMEEEYPEDLMVFQP